MADEQDASQKTEDPTQKHIEEAEQEGSIARSVELSHWFMIVGATMVVVLFAGPMAQRVMQLVAPFLASPDDISTDPGNLGHVISDLFTALGLLLLPALGLILLAALAGTLIQHRPVISFDVLLPNLGRLSPLNGLKRIIAPRGGLEFLKGLLKLAIIGGVVVTITWPRLDVLPLLVSYDVASILVMTKSIAVSLLTAVIAIMLAIAGADLGYQKWAMLRSLRMSKQELRDEAKQSEGDPAVKARIRGIRNERSRRRMMAAVPEADVVVANPTHFAVALKYDAATMEAPKVVAKGQDLVALRIREIAEEHKIPVVENPPLARALHGACEVDREIPVEHYRAVAEVIGYVMRLKGGRGGRPAARSAGDQPRPR
jgi:flagellar biosynthetic protein FlhB